MNVYTVGKASQGLADYVCKHFPVGKQSVAIGYDSRINSQLFAETAAGVFAANGLRTVNVLTGFKYIGEQIGLLEAEGRVKSFVFGFEESCGYLSGGYVWDKDGVGATLLICEMAAYYAAQGQTLLDRMEELYKIYGRREDRLISYAFEGPDGLEEMNWIMDQLRGPVKELGGVPVIKRLDYAEGLDGLPKSDVLQFTLADGSTVTLRPSGTEPKLKVYVSLPKELFQ